MQSTPVEFFKAHSILNWLLGDPTNTGKARLPLALLILAYVVCRVLLMIIFAIADHYGITKTVREKLKLPPPPKASDSKSETAYKVFSEPLTFMMEVSAGLLDEVIRAHYTSGNVLLLFRKYWLNIVGAVVISALLYGIAVCLVIGFEGIPVDRALALAEGDWNLRAKMFFEFITNNPYLNTSLLTFYFLCVIAYAKVHYLEIHHTHVRRLGVSATLPLGEWDEIPKLNIPHAQLVQAANETIHDLLGQRSTELIRVKLASGFDTIGPNGYLNDILLRPNIRWEILLLDPDSDGAKRRSGSYQSPRASDPPKFASQAAYSDAIKKVLEHLKQIHQTNGTKIQIRLYKHTPQWRIFLSAGLGMVSGFGPGIGPFS